MYREIVQTFRLYSDLQLSENELTEMGKELRFYWSKLEQLESVLEQLEQKL
ncbi:hypothetical protein D3C73_1200530 [compost metagenome]